MILVDQWRTATVLNPVAATIWASFDGESPLAEIIDELAELTGTDHILVTNEVLSLVRNIGALGLIEGVGPPDDFNLDVRIEEIPRFEKIGSELPSFNAIDLEGTEITSASLGGSETILINWNPHCGYCASITHTLGACEADLHSRGTKLVLLASGSAEANHNLIRSAGLTHTKVLRLLDGQTNPFGGAGTPAAFHLDAKLSLASAPAYGNVDVPDLLERLAGIQLHDIDGTATISADGSVRYLLQAGGACPSGTGVEHVPHWVTTRVYRLGDFHVGLRCGTDATVAALDALFQGSAIDDPAAGHTFVVSLAEPQHSSTASATADTGSGTVQNPISANLLVQGSNAFVRSGSPGRVLRGLVSRMHDEMSDFDTSTGRLQVYATAALISEGIVLLQPGLYVLGERLQPLLASRGIALADIPHPEIDLETFEVVLPEPSIAIDRNVLTRYDIAVDPELECPTVLPGRYPLIAWGVMHPSDTPVTRFSPAEAAVSTLSLVRHSTDAASRIAQLGKLFGQIPGFGIWYHSEEQFVRAVCKALGLD